MKTVRVGAGPGFARCLRDGKQRSIGGSQVRGEIKFTQVGSRVRIEGDVTGLARCRRARRLRHDPLALFFGGLDLS